MAHDSTARLRLELCEWAASNADGTYTIIRGGINHWNATLPLNIGTRDGSLVLFVEIPGGTLAEGHHDFVAAFYLPGSVPLCHLNGRLGLSKH